MSTGSADFDMDDTDDAVAMVREPASGMSFPPYSGLLRPSATASAAKRPARGTPIAMPTTQRRESNFSSFIPNAALVTGAREGGNPKKPLFGQSRLQHTARHVTQSTAEVQRSAHSPGSLESRMKQKPEEVVLLSDEDDMKDPKTVKRKKHAQEADTYTSESHTAEYKSGSIVSRMKKNTTPVVSGSLSPYMEVDPTPASTHRSHTVTTAVPQKLERGSTSAKSGLLSANPASPLTKPNAAFSKISSTSTKPTQPSVKPVTPSAKPVSSPTVPSSSSAKPVPFSTTPTSPPTKSLFSIFASPSSPTSPVSSPSHAKVLSPVTPSLSEKSLQMGVGTFPHLPLEKVRVGTKIDIKRQKMVVQLGPDRFIILIDKNSTKIPHETLRAVGYYIGGDTKLLVLTTSKKLDPESILAPYYDPAQNSGKGRRLVLYTTSEGHHIEEYCDRLASMGYSTHKLTSDSADKYLDGLGAQSPAESSAATNAIAPNIPGSPGDIQPRQTLFMFPFKSTAKTRSIAVHIEDLARLFESDFLNDILIEFGLKYVYEGLEKSHPELAKRTYIFNSFFYQRLIAKPAAGMSAYDAVKSWTNKIDLFDMDFIVVPICEKAHWYLAIITNPSLLLRDSQDQPQTKSNESSSTASSIPSPVREPSSVTPPDSPVLPSITESMESLAGSTEGLLRIKGERGTDKGVTSKTENATGRPKRVPRSSIPVDVDASPYIIILDSLGGYHPTVSKALRSYLQQELSARKGINKTLTTDDIVGRYAKPPQQQNFSDCGLYLLHFAEVFLKNPRRLLDGIVNNKPELEKYWMADELPNKREYYRDVVMQLAEDYKVYLAEMEISATPSGHSLLKARTDRTGK
ncbi:hypothetical protein BGZ96_001495 [Linnemannia gamsii]|uniref:Ubiquitin-like protease family profile domain-containing protein n=1 Tax=Linnemannia gamsii TaxID=64522 RepID=A0ABQ7KAV6_9FUNG|nr:hypothetical protein BGZ96_001495 [Linnemannia gamsii]